MHCCPEGSAMIGAHIDQNTFKCAKLNNPTGVRSLDTGTVRFDMHTCPQGQVMVGLHVDLNQLACQTIPNNPVVDEWVDSGTADSFPMHVCTSATNPIRSRAVMTGIRVDQNRFACGINYDAVAPLPPTNLVVTKSDSTRIYLQWKDNNDPNAAVPFSVRIFERLPDGREIERGEPSPLGPRGGTMTTEWWTSTLAQKRNACVKIRLLNAWGTTMFSNLACGPGPGTTPPSPVGTIGLGNGVHVTNPEMTDWNYYPTAFDDFRIAWHVCNSKSTNSGPLDVQVRESAEGSLQDTFSFPLSNVPAGACVQQNTDLITTFSTQHWNWDVYINGAFAGGTGMSFRE